MEKEKVIQIDPDWDDLDTEVDWDESDEAEERRENALERVSTCMKFLLSANVYLAEDEKDSPEEAEKYSKDIRKSIAMVLDNLEHIRFELENQFIPQ